MLIKQQKREHLSLLLNICNFNKNKYIFNLHSEEYAVFLIHLFTLYNIFSILFIFLLLFCCPIACNIFFNYLIADCLLVLSEFF